MEQLIIRVADKDKAKMLFEIIAALDFVNSVEIKPEETPILDDKPDFFTVAGFWEKKNLPSPNPNLTPKEKAEKWRKVIAKLPQKSANLPDEALHRDTIYDDED